MHHCADIVVGACEVAIIVPFLCSIDINDLAEGLKSNVKSSDFDASILFIINDTQLSESVFDNDFRTVNK